MNRKGIPATNEQLPVIGLGTWKSFDVGPGVNERKGPSAVIEDFLKLGGRLIDSSPMYGKSETVVGDLVASTGAAERVFMATKVWTTGKQQGIDEMRASMKKLRVDRIDLMQVHNLLDVETQLATLADWKAEGLVRYVGITHYTAVAHAEVARVLKRHDLDFLQINYSAAEREAEGLLLPMAQERGIAVIANRPLATGSLVRSVAKKPLPGLARDLGCESWPELLLKFVVSHSAVTCAIPATANVEHLRANMRAGDGPMPNEKQRAEIARLAV
jgi:diketogulonate reductase-like aldo/keto reductase